MEDIQHCPLCNATASRPFDQRSSVGRTIAYVVCGRCGFVYQSPRMTRAELEAFYTAAYRQTYQGQEGPSRNDLVVQRGRAEHLLHLARGAIAPPERHLDLGASSGALLERFQREFGSLVVGVEPGDAYRRYAADRGLKMHESLDALDATNPEPFDLISLAHVLEHLPDPVATLVRLRHDFLAPGGWLLVEVPNLYAHTAFEIAHLSAFSPHTLRETVRKAGFSTRGLHSHGQPRSVILPLYLTLLAQPAESPVGEFPPRPERGVRLKRSWGMLRRRILGRVLPQLAWLPLP